VPGVGDALGGIFGGRVPGGGSTGGTPIAAYAELTKAGGSTLAALASSLTSIGFGGGKGGAARPTRAAGAELPGRE